MSPPLLVGPAETGRSVLCTFFHKGARVAPLLPGVEGVESVEGVEGTGGVPP